VKSFVIEEVSVTAINSGSFRGAPPTKKPLTWHGAAILEMKDKRVVRQWSFANRAEVLTQIGVKFAR
jgi:predicted ester cyclase